MTQSESNLERVNRVIAFVRRHPNAGNQPYFSIAERQYRPASWYATNTRGVIIPKDAILVSDLDNISDDVVQVFDDCQSVELAFFTYLTELNAHSKWWRECLSVYDLINHVRMCLSNTTVDAEKAKRCWAMMSVPGMMDDYFTAYQSFMRIAGRTPIEQRVFVIRATTFEIDSFHFNKLYI